ncbi:juvenile hormone epoxide hydrolase-like [Nylanderia fulva]|uniref:juvenile hormone epoxide hydrolase-like n=1 Tax=Nylanderia fulva TaxID=613905 RepID=UPI0010FB820F|nr:juvenile hormone epoxide hydrolase-like [Nylanderia fulva]XP_029168150.1 juvenile hormone epoxide hydrolase-like [Nylanderia fulva]
MIILSKLLRHWAYTYDFKAGEKYINSYPQFVTNIQGLYIHFVHITRHVKKPNVEKNHMPLLLLHGWPSSIMEFYKDIQLKFAEEREIIIPSLPGFGFSSSPTIPGFTCIEMSVVLKNLMLRLGHDKFRVQDGSYGANNGHIMSILFPQHVDDTLNIHDKQEMPFVKYTKRFRNTFTQANQIYTTSIYFDLNKSPNVLAEYLIEQILRADPLNVLEKKININTEMIDNLMMYWRTKCIYRAMQTYKAQFEKLPTDFIDLLLHTYGIIKE